MSTSSDSSVVSPSPSATPSGFSVADIKSGFLVFLIALPLCLGIAMASGFPPIAGVLSAIVGGILVSFLGHSRLTIKGPAAGLIVIALGCVQELGQGDPVVGYKRALAVGVMAALVQIAFSLLRVATVGVAMSPSVVHGMLAAIGIIIISKQSHTMLGVAPSAKEPLHLLLELPHSIANANPEILALAAIAMVVLFGWPYLKHRYAKLVPAPVVVLALTVPLGLWFDLDHGHNYSLLSHSYHVGPEFLVRLPPSLWSAVTLPDFSVATSAASLKYVVMFALVGTIESTLSVLAVDSMDPEKRASDLNKDLFACGLGNLVSALIGGLPMISEIVRSKANVDAGAQSKWSNFAHGTLLLAFVALAPGLLQEIPLAALAAMLVYTGTRLAAPKEFAHAREVGVDQLALFVVTLVVTLATDLLVGVAAGIIVKLLIHWYRGVPLGALLRTGTDIDRSGSSLRVRMRGAAIFTGLLPLRRALANVEGIDDVVVDLQDAAVVDHTFLSRLEAMGREWPQTKLTVTGLDALHPVSSHPQATRRRRKA